MLGHELAASRNILIFETANTEDHVAVRELIDEAIDGYRGDSLQMVLIGSDYWNKFLSETGLRPMSVGAGDLEITYRGISCRRGMSPDSIKLVVGD